MIPVISKAAAFAEHGGALYALTGGMEKHLFYSGGSDRMLSLWNLQQLQPEKFSAMLPAAVYSLCIVKEKQLLFVGTGEGNIHILSLEKKQEIKVLKNHTGQVFCLYYSKKNQCVYAGGAEGLLSLTSTESLTAIHIKKACETKIRDIALNRDETEIALACGDGSIRIIDMHSMEEKHTVQAHAISANTLAYHPVQDVLLSGGRDGYMKLWDTKNGYVNTKTIPAHTSNIYSIVFNPGHHLFASGSRDKSVKVWDSSTFDLLVRLGSDNRGGHVNSVNKILWPDDQYLISTGDDRAVIVWKVEDKMG